MDIRGIIDELRDEGFTNAVDLFNARAGSLSEVARLLRTDTSQEEWRVIVGLDELDIIWSVFAGLDIKSIRETIADKEHHYPPFIWPGNRLYAEDSETIDPQGGTAGFYNIVPARLNGGHRGCGTVCLAVASRGMNRSFGPTYVGTNLAPLYGLDFAEAMLGVIAVLMSCDAVNEETVLLTNDFSSCIFEKYYAPLLKRIVSKKPGRKFLVAERRNGTYMKCAVVK